LAYVVATYNATVHEFTGFSPNFLTFGRELANPVNVAMGNPPVDRLSVNDYADHLVTSLHEAYCDAGSTLARGCCVPTPTQRAIPPGSVKKVKVKVEHLI